MLQKFITNNSYPMTEKKYCGVTVTESCGEFGAAPRSCQCHFRSVTGRGQACKRIAENMPAPAFW